LAPALKCLAAANIILNNKDINETTDTSDNPKNINTFTINNLLLLNLTVVQK
jgi:hypothetical protein